MVIHSTFEDVVTKQELVDVSQSFHKGWTFRKTILISLTCAPGTVSCPLQYCLVYLLLPIRGFVAVIATSLFCSCLYKTYVAVCPSYLSYIRTDPPSPSLSHCLFLCPFLSSFCSLPLLRDGHQSVTVVIDNCVCVFAWLSLVYLQTDAVCSPPIVRTARRSEQYFPLADTIPTNLFNIKRWQ